MTLFLSIHGQQDSRYHEQSYDGSSYLDERTIRVYLPPSYLENNDSQYPVLYMMDGQNLFFDSLSYFGHSWRISDVSEQLVKDKSIFCNKPIVKVAVLPVPDCACAIKSLPEIN